MNEKKTNCDRRRDILAGVGRRMELRRKELGLTLADVAERVGVAASTIQRYERAEFDDMKRPMVEAIARALAVQPEWFYDKDQM